MGHDVFISYSSKDKPIADGICASLEAAGIRCWIAPRDITPGEDWPTSISAAITKSKVMVLVFSADSNSSKQVGNELSLAFNNNLVIIPFKIENIEPELGKQYYLARTHWLEAMNPPTLEQIQTLVETVRSVVSGMVTNGVVQPSHLPMPSVSQPFTAKKRKFRWGFLWMAGVLMLIVLGVLFWPKIQGMLASPTAIPTKAATLTDQPGSTATISPTITPTATPGIGSTWVRPADGMVMVYVPAGEFNMGSNNGDPDEQPVHPITLDPFWIDETEVTNRMYIGYLNSMLSKIEISEGKVFIEEKKFRITCTMCGEGWVDQIAWNGSEFSVYPGYEDHPSLAADRDYCEWVGARLPSEAEWEKAARGNLEGMDYPWGNEAPTCAPGAINGAQFSDCGGNTIEVGSFKPNGYGIYDMAGNVWEIVNDWYDETYYSRSPGSNPPGPTSGVKNILRGGAWDYAGDRMRSANRFNGVSMDYQHYDSYVGVRCARDASP